MTIDTKFKLLDQRRTKIVATLGPASVNAETIGKLIEAGVNVFRLNFSHGTHEDHRTAYTLVRREASRRNAPVAILGDLCGPKIRVGEFENGSIEIKAGELVTVTTRDVKGVPGLIPSQFKELARDAKVGSRILLDDGNLELSVKEIKDSELTCLVVAGGKLKNKKGMNLPGMDLNISAITEKDRRDLQFAVEIGVDFIALSFVRNAADVHELRDLVRNCGGKYVQLIAKIEMPQALTDIGSILDAADGIMVARGDLGVELPPETVPIAQNELIDMGRRKSKPVIVATQMMESMISAARPTRAEVSDVSNAVRAGCDAVMLSAETASGMYPVEVVKMMDSIIRQTEAYFWHKDGFRYLSLNRGEGSTASLHEGMSKAISSLSRDLGVSAIAVLAEIGYSARVVSSFRPSAPIVVLFPSEEISRRGCLYWGVHPVVKPFVDESRMRFITQDTVRTLGLAMGGRNILMLRGFNRNAEMNSPTISVVPISDDDA